MYQRFIRKLIWVFLRVLYRVNVTGQQNIPAGGAVLIPNHVSYLDAMLVAAHIDRPIRFAMYWKLYRAMRWIVAPLGAFPIAGKSENETIYQQSFDIIADTLDKGGLVCIFPEGRLTTNGRVGDFKNGILKIVARNQVPVVPVGLRNLWGSYFSKKAPGWLKLPRHFRKPVTLRIGRAMRCDTPLDEMRDRVGALLG